MQNNRQHILPLSFVVAVYVVLAILSRNYCYFWDTVQQISNEAHWFYLSDFRSLLIPADNEFGVSATGYHPPLLGITTAFLWKIFGYELWVSHAVSTLCAAVLIFNAQKLCSIVVQRYAGWIALIVLLDPVVLTQFVCASPDFVLFTAFVVALRAVFDKKPVVLALALIFLCGINMRGVFAALMLFAGHVFYSCQEEKSFSIKIIYKNILPYLPAIILLVAYYALYFSQSGWFFGGGRSNYSEHYSMPHDLQTVLKHFAEFVWRQLEYGRFFVWLLAAVMILKVYRAKDMLFNKREKMLGLIIVLLTALYLLFVFITQMPFGTRYFMPQLLLLVLFAFSLLSRYFSEKKLKVIIGLTLFFQLTGHFWVYPEKVAQPWDATLLHIPYYELRKECFDYIDENDIDYNELAAGFALYGNRQYVELIPEKKIVGNDMEKCRFFIYSNISNLEDEKVDELKNPQQWKMIKHVEKAPIFISIYQKAK